MSADAEPHYVYEATAEDGSVLYVGCTLNPTARVFTSQRKEADWWPRMCRLTVTRHDSRSEALDAERARIAEVRPLFNRHHNLETSAVRTGGRRVTWTEKFAKDHALGLEHPMRDKCPDCLKLVFGVVLG